MRKKIAEQILDAKDHITERCLDDGDKLMIASEEELVLEAEKVLEPES